jgi:two-component system cell cycle response regulator
MRRFPGTLAGALLLAIWAHALIGFGGAGTQDFFGRWMHDAVILAAALGCLTSAIRGGSARLAWGVLAAGLLATAAGDLIYSAAPDLAAVPVPSISDPFWLAIYPCEYVALLALTRGRVGRTLWATRLDGLAGGLAAAAVLACVTVSLAVQASADAPFWEAATNLAYPVGDLILLGSIVSAVGLAGWRLDRLWGTLGIAIVAMEAADLMYMTGAQGAMGPIADALAATGMVGLARAAALAPGTRAARPTTGAGLFVPVGCGALALGVLALGVPLHFNAVALGLAAAALGVVLVRMALALSENHALLAASRVEATTDALTGLSNRRKLQLDLAVALHDDARRALVLLDLNGFKAYNDTYGHVAGDLLLAQLGAALASAVDGRGATYRMGGDEFCVLAPLTTDLHEFSAECAAALATQGDGFSITAAHGAALLPDEGRDASTVLAIADARMYRQKHAGSKAVLTAPRCPEQDSNLRPTP